jgi:hypothetical protein
MRYSTLDMRSLLLDIELTPNNRPPSSTTVIRMHIQPGDGLRRSQHDGQLQLCVPLVTMNGASYRPTKRPGTNNKPTKPPKEAIG